MNEGARISKETSPGVPAPAVISDDVLGTQGASALPKINRFGNHITFVVFFAMSVALFGGQLHALVSLAYRSEYYSHTIVVPLLAGYLVFRERKQIFKASRASLWEVIPLVLAGGFLFALSEWGLPSNEQQVRLCLAILAVVLIWLGGFAFCYGRHAFRAGLFPLLLLGLMVPLPLVIMEGFIHLVRAGSTDVASSIFNALGVPVFRHGFYFVLPGLTIEVAKECSGIHSTLALVVVSLLAGYLFLRSPWKRVLLILLVVPIVDVTNGLRIATLTLLAEYVDKGILGSSLHRRGGILFFLLALMLLTACLRLFGSQANRQIRVGK